MYSFDLIYVQAWSRPYIRSFDLIYVQVDLIYLTLDLIYQILTIYLKTDFCPIWRVIPVGLPDTYFCLRSTSLAGTSTRILYKRLTHMFKVISGFLLAT